MRTLPILFIAFFAMSLGTPNVQAQERELDKVYHGKNLKHWIADLTHKDAERRFDAAFILGEIGEEGAPAIPELIFVARDPNPKFRRLVGKALSTKGPRVVAVLIKYLKHRDKNLRTTVAYSLGLLRRKPRKAISPLIEAFGDSERAVRLAAWNSLAKYGKPAVPALVEALQKKNRLVRESAAEAVRLMGVPAAPTLPFLIINLKDKSERVRAISGYAIGSFGKIGAKAYPALVQVYKNTDETAAVRASAIYSLAQLGTVSQKIMPAFLRTLSHAKENVTVRAATAQALGRLAYGRPSILKVLMAYSKNRHEKIRYFSVLGIGHMGASGEVAIPTLIRSFSSKSESTRVRCAAIRSLGLMGHTALPTLINALGEEFDKVVTEAFRTIEAVAIKELQPSVKKLVKGASHSNPNVRLGIAILFGKLGVPKAQIMDALKTLSSDSVPAVNLAARQSLALLRVSKR